MACGALSTSNSPMSTPVVYEAMFRQPIDARFAEEGNETQLREAFDALADVIGDAIGTEVFWVPCTASSCSSVPANAPPGSVDRRIEALSTRFASRAD